MKKLPDFVQFAPMPKPNMRQLFTAASSDALDLMQRMLVFDPLKRISAKDVEIVIFLSA
jgi:cyclin-dependent kinase 7